ncbi:hypothetical protein [Arthrobacter agilis]|uniref:hypothetical protein n=1 Tax=Arthrobacter agilis TaxID=37921 RepID=UPI0027887F90|nr:hypothetical protein [Arthrobacter agilis]MDQ0735334.1 hypothetical protein [Arthrobacter agilis]
MSREEFYAGMTLLRVHQATRGEKEQPLELDWPWPDAEAEVTDEERAVLVQRLRASSAFAQIRNPEE